MVRFSFYRLFPLLPLLLVTTDQVTKLLVHQYMLMGASGEIHLLGDFLKLHYLTNPGMAFGLKVGMGYGKALLTGLRLLISGGLVWYFFYVYVHKSEGGILWYLGFILGGALGNLIDSTFYGVLLNNAPEYAPTPWFYGQVIDMIYVNIWHGYLPEDWIIGGGTYLSILPIFNLADVYIFVGLGGFLWKQFRDSARQPKEINTAEEEIPDSFPAKENAEAPLKELSLETPPESSPEPSPESSPASPPESTQSSTQRKEN